jgi:purine-cytosine permease-like protein
MKVKAHLAVQQLMLAAALTVGLVACGSSGNSSSGASSSPSTTSPASTAAASPTTAASGSAAAAIAANWEAFFNAKTPTAKRVALLQDGSTFASVIKAQAGSGLAASATAKVTKVTVESATKAKVIYSILLGGQPALSNQTGVAVYQNGTWKVGVASFCGLLATENGGSTANLPSACKSAG